MSIYENKKHEGRGGGQARGRVAGEGMSKQHPMTVGEVWGKSHGAQEGASDSGRRVSGGEGQECGVGRAIRNACKRYGLSSREREWEETRNKHQSRQEQRTSTD